METVIFAVMKDVIRSLLAVLKAVGNALTSLGQKDARCLGMLFGLFLLFIVFTLVFRKPGK